MMPKQTEIELPLLKCLDEMGGRGTPKDIYPRVTQFFPNMTEADLAETLSSGGNKWTNRIQWVRQRLVVKGEMTSPEHGIWAITDKGRRRLATGGLGVAPSQPTETVGDVPSAPLTNLEELVEDYFEAFKQKTLQKLLDLTPKRFERFAGVLLSAYGFSDIRVTVRTADGCIDVHGKLKIGLARMNVAFQCKRWQGQVGRPEIDKFRGAIQGEFEQGIFFTTSDFSSQAREVSIRKNATPIVLLNGDAIVELMVGKGLGIRRSPVEVYEDQIETLFEEEES